MTARGDKLSFMSLVRHWIHGILDFEFIMLNDMPLSKKNIEINTWQIRYHFKIKFLPIIKAGEKNIIDHCDICANPTSFDVN